MASLSLLALLEFDAQQGLLPIAHAPSSEDLEEVMKLTIPGILPRRDGPNTPQATYFLLYLQYCPFRSFGDKHTIAMSCSIDGTQYPRNVYSFTVLMVLVSHPSDFNIGAYSRVASGLVKRLVISEKETGVLSRKENKKGRITRLLEEIMQQLIEIGHCSVLVEESNGMMMNLRLEEPLPVVNTILKPDSCIPAFVVDSSTLLNCLAEDITFSRILVLIDGERSLGQISLMAHVDLGFTRKAISDLV